MNWPAWSRNNQDCDNCGTNHPHMSSAECEHITNQYEAMQDEPDDPIWRGREEDRTFADPREHGTWGP